MEVVDKAVLLVQDPFGNYVVQYVLEQVRCCDAQAVMIPSVPVCLAWQRARKEPAKAKRPWLLHCHVVYMDTSSSICVFMYVCPRIRVHISAD